MLKMSCCSPKIVTCCACLVLALATGPGFADASSRRFVVPDDAGFVDVTQPPYNVRGDGRTDDTAAIQRALDDHPNANQIIYLPDGEYLISDTLRWPKGDRGGTEYKRTILQGQSRDHTLVRLRDKCEGFGDPDKPKAMVWTGSKPAQRFRNGIWNLTFDTGRGNPGAIGVQYIANNQGSVRHLLIRSGDPDGAGLLGLDLGYTDEQGPCLIKDVTVEGFDVGVSTKHVVDSVIFEHLTLRGQNRVGLRNDGQCLSIRKLRSDNAVPAIENRNINGLIVLLDSELAGTGNAGEQDAIRNLDGALLVRDTQVTGYKRAVLNKARQGTGQGAETGAIDLFVSHQPLAPGGKAAIESARTLRLPIRETPALPQPPLDTWAGPHQFGGDPHDNQDDTEAVQKAIDSGARVIYFPHPTKRSGTTGWKIDGQVLVRGHVERITALEGRLSGSGTFRVVEGEPDVVTFDRLDTIYRHINIDNASQRTLVLSSVTQGKGRFTFTGGGDLYFEDVVGGPWTFPKINVWARQLNPESKETKVTNDGGRFWVLGLKTENEGTIVHTLNGGRTEVLGGFIYAQGRPKRTPMFIVEGANSALIASVGETTWNQRNFKTIVSVDCGGETRTLEYSPEIYWRNNKAAMLPLLMALPAAE